MVVRFCFIFLLPLIRHGNQYTKTNLVCLGNMQLTSPISLLTESMQDIALVYSPSALLLPVWGVEYLVIRSVQNSVQNAVGKTCIISHFSCAI